MASTEGAPAAQWARGLQAEFSSVLPWQLHGLSLGSPTSQMRKPRPVEVEWLPRVMQIEINYLLMTIGPRRGREGVAYAKKQGDPDKELPQDIVLRTCAQPCAGAIGADKGPPSPAGARGGSGERH